MANDRYTPSSGIERENGFMPIYDVLKDQAQARGYDFDNESRNWEREGEILETLITRGEATKEEEDEFRTGLQLGRYRARDQEVWGKHQDFALKAKDRQDFADETGLYPEEVEQIRSRDRGRMFSFSAGAANNVTLGNADNLAATANRVVGADSEINRIARKMKARGFKGDAEKAAAQLVRTDAVEDNPYSSMAGDIAGYFAPGAGIYMGAKTAGKGALQFVGRQSARSLPTGTTVGARSSRYAGVLTREATYGAIDGAIWGATVGMSDARARARWDENMKDPSLREEALSGAMWGAAFGGLLSPAYRTGRSAAISAKERNLSGFFSDQRMMPNTRKQELSRDILIQNGATFEDLKKVESHIQAGDWESAAKIVHDPAYKSAKLLYGRIKSAGGVDSLRQRIKDNEYVARDDVDHMLLELMGEGTPEIRRLGRSLTTVDGEAKEIAEEAYKKRDVGAPGRIKRALDAALEADGTTFYEDEAAARAFRREQSQPLYDAAYANELSEEAWEGVTKQGADGAPSITSLPAFGRAVKDAIGLGKNTARSQADLNAVAELEDLAAAIKADEDPAKISVRALQLLDQTLTKANKAAMKPDAPPEVLGSGNVQRRLRGATDESSGLNVPREFYKEAKDAETAFRESRKMASDSVDIETLEDRFEGRSDRVKRAVLLGFVRGLEDGLARSGSGRVALNKIFKTPRQRQKLERMADEVREASRAATKEAKDALDEAVAKNANNIPELRKRYNKVKDEQGAVTEKFRNLFGSDDVRGTGNKRRTLTGVLENEGTFAKNKNEMTGGSETAKRRKAVEEEELYATRAEQIVDTIFSPREGLKRISRAGTNRVFRSIIYDTHANKQLGEWLFGQASAERRKAAMRAKRKGEKYAPEDLATSNVERYNIILDRIQNMVKPAKRADDAGGRQSRRRFSARDSATEQGVATKAEAQKLAKEIADSGMSAEMKRNAAIGLVGMLSAGLLGQDAYADTGGEGEGAINMLPLLAAVGVAIFMRRGRARVGRNIDNVVSMGVGDDFDPETANKIRNTVKTINSNLRKAAAKRRGQEHFKAVGQRIKIAAEQAEQAAAATKRVDDKIEPDVETAQYYYDEPSFTQELTTFAFVSSPIWLLAAAMIKSWFDHQEHMEEWRFERDLEEMYEKLEQDYRIENGLPQREDLPTLKPSFTGIPSPDDVPRFIRGSDGQMKTNPEWQRAKEAQEEREKAGFGWDYEEEAADRTNDRPTRFAAQGQSTRVSTRRRS